MKKLLTTILSFVMVFSFSTMVFAAELDTMYVNESEIEIIPDNALNGTYTAIQSEIGPRSLDPTKDIRYRKKNTTTTYEWSGYKRVSDDLITDSAGGSLSSTKSVSFGPSVAGSIYGLLDISVGGTLESETGYVLNVDPYKHVYMVYRVKYKVEKGTRECYDALTGKVLSSNKYTVKSPQHGEYSLAESNE